MGGRPIAPMVDEFFRTHPNRAYTAIQVSRMTGLEPRQITQALANAQRQGQSWVDKIEDLDPDKRTNKRYRLAAAATTVPIDVSPNGVGAAELVTAANDVALTGSLTITFAGHSKQGPVVKDQNGKLYTLKEL